jgi:hypothetical protein
LAAPPSAVVQALGRGEQAQLERHIEAAGALIEANMNFEE